MDKFWKENIFGELNYKKYFKYFLIITCSLNSEEENGDSLFGFMKSKIRKAMEIWSKEKEFTVHLENKTVETNLKENLLEYRILSGYEEKGRCRVDEE
ncbi:unnamed protein product [Meloidogyne enterolobii]|uniref:Uncharacterized protein n=1 Tax=Meloidogyne enterolobii TaxID=390850 RepID=A0ACB0XS15_MELEN